MYVCGWEGVGGCETVKHLSKDMCTFDMQKPHCSVPFEVPYIDHRHSKLRSHCIDMCTFESSEMIMKTPPYTGQLTIYYGPSGVLIMEVSLYRTANYGPNGVLITEVSLYRTANYGPSGVLITEVSLYRTANNGPSGVLIIEVSLYRTANYGPSGVLITEVPLYS